MIEGFVKAGTKVRRIEGEWAGMKVGDVDIVKIDNADGHLVLDKFMENDRTTHRKKNLEIVVEEKAAIATHIITYDEKDKDPYVLSFGIKDKEQKVKTLFENDDVINSSIRVHKIDSTELVDYKIVMKKVK